jgi:hypothetical protein
MSNVIVTISFENWTLKKHITVALTHFDVKMPFWEDIQNNFYSGLRKTYDIGNSLKHNKMVSEENLKIFKKHPLKNREK